MGRRRVLSLMSQAPHTFTFSALTFSVLSTPSFHPQGWVASRNLKCTPVIGNWSAGLNGVLYTTCTNLKDNDGGDPGRSPHLSWEAFSRYPLLWSLPSPIQPSTPDTDSSNAPQRTQTCPLAPLDARGRAGTMLSKIFHASVPIVPRDIMGQCFLHPFLIPAGYNDILCKINT